MKQEDPLQSYESEHRKYEKALEEIEQEQRSCMEKEEELNEVQYEIGQILMEMEQNQSTDGSYAELLEIQQQFQEGSQRARVELEERMEQLKQEEQRVLQQEDACYQSYLQKTNGEREI